MGRTLSSRNQTEIAQSGTKPILLFELGFSPILRLSTYADLTWNGYSWILAPIALADLQATEGGGMRGSIEFNNLSNLYSALVLNQGVRARTCRIWQLYGDSPYAADDGVPLFDGLMDEVPEIGDKLSITLAGAGTLARSAPDLPLSAWLGADMTAPGTRISWGGQTYILESRNG